MQRSGGMNINLEDWTSVKAKKWKQATCGPLTKDVFFDLEDPCLTL